MEINSIWKSPLGMWKKITTLIIFVLSMTAGGCMAQEINVNVVVFNYTNQPLVDMTIDGHYVGGYFQEYGPGGTGGGVYCCIDVVPGSITVAWEVGWPTDKPIPADGLKRSAKALLSKAPGESKYLGVHVYSDNKVEFTLSRDIPPERKESGS